LNLVKTKLNHGLENFVDMVDNYKAEYELNVYNLDHSQLSKLQTSNWCGLELFILMLVRKPWSAEEEIIAKN